MYEFNLKLTEREIMALCFALSNQEDKHIDFIDERINYSELSENLRNQLVEQLWEV